MSSAGLPKVDGGIALLVKRLPPKNGDCSGALAAKTPPPKRDVAFAAGDSTTALGAAESVPQLNLLLS